MDEYFFSNLSLKTVPLAIVILALLGTLWTWVEESAIQNLRYLGYAWILPVLVSSPMIVPSHQTMLSHPAFSPEE
jgi:hypothetical protein